MFVSVSCLNRTILSTEIKYFEPPRYEVMSSVRSFYLCTTYIFAESALFLSGKYTHKYLPQTAGATGDFKWAV